MNKKISLALLFVFVMAFSLALTGCSTQAEKNNFSGYWELTEIESENPTIAMNAAEAEASQVLGMRISLQLKDDGSVSSDLFESGKVTWEKIGETEGLIKLKDVGNIKFTTDGYNLALDGGAGTIMHFERD